MNLYTLPYVNDTDNEPVTLAEFLVLDAQDRYPWTRQLNGVPVNYEEDYDGLQD